MVQICSNKKFYTCPASYTNWKESIASCLELVTIPATGLSPGLLNHWGLLQLPNLLIKVYCTKWQYCRDITRSLAWKSAEYKWKICLFHVNYKMWLLGLMKLEIWLEQIELELLNPHWPECRGILYPLTVLPLQASQNSHTTTSTLGQV